MNRRFVRLSLLGLALTTTIHTAQGATFQYIFNNVEQGTGGVANPSIAIDGQKVKKNNVPVDSVPAVLPPEEEVAASSSSSVASASAFDSVPEPAMTNRFRVTASGSRLAQSVGSDWTYTQGDLKRLRTENNITTASLGLSIAASRDVAFTGFWIAPQSGGSHGFGAEMEFIPVRVAVLGNQEFIELGGILGASTLGRDVLTTKPGTLHAGLRGNVNFHRHLGITAAARSNFTDRRSYRFTQAELGLAYRF